MQNGQLGFAEVFEALTGRVCLNVYPQCAYSGYERMQSVAPRFKLPWQSGSEQN